MPLPIEFVRYPLPVRLYRFRSMNPAERWKVREIIVEARNYWAPASSFNDPYDCKPRYSFDVSDDEIEAGLASNAALTEAQRSALRKSARALSQRRPRTKKARESWVQAQELHLQSKIGVLCLSADPTHPLLWSHYADSHTGVCLEFQTSWCFSSPFPTAVEYVKDRPTINPFFEAHAEIFHKSLLTKAEVWRYESEHRFLNFNGPGAVIYPPYALSAVILGAKASDETRNILIEWCKEAVQTQPEVNIRMYRARLSDSVFRVQVPSFGDNANEEPEYEAHQQRLF